MAGLWNEVRNREIVHTYIYIWGVVPVPLAFFEIWMKVDVQSWKSTLQRIPQYHRLPTYDTYP